MNKHNNNQAIFQLQGINWFSEALKILSVNMSPGWPDNFGKKINKFLTQNGGGKIQTLSLFTGAGGLDIGFHDAGFYSKQMVEIENKFVASLKENTKTGAIFHGSDAICTDIRKYIPKGDLNVEFIIGGPPCQTFSSAGRRASGVLGTSDARGNLFKEYVRLLKQLKPKCFLFENVYGIIGAQQGKPWQLIQKAFEDAGYKIYFKVLDAADYGVPQHRERLIIVGLKKDEFDGDFKFPEPTHGPDSADQRPYYTAGSAVKKLVDIEPFKKINGRYGYLLDNIPPGLNYSFYTEKLGHPNPVFAWRSKFSDFLYKANPNVPVRAIKAQGGQYTGPLSWDNRYFTVRELKRLQTIPDNYNIVGSRITAIHQIGNSVPPQLARILALAIADQIFGVNLPFKIKYMEAEYQLSFRKKKALATQDYLIKAQNAIRTTRKIYKRKMKLEENEMIRFLGSKFEWSMKEISNSYKAIIKSDIADNTLTLKVGNDDETNKFVIEVTPKNSKWGMKYKAINLVSMGRKKMHIPVLWRALEEIVSSESHIADLIQFSGYYQYSPSIRTKITLSSLAGDSNFWKIIKMIFDANQSIRLSVTEYSELLNLKPSEIDVIFKELRKIGYEIRNSRTNSQIEKDFYLIPYIFPTLKPESVQLNKNL